MRNALPFQDGIAPDARQGNGAIIQWLTATLLTNKKRAKTLGPRSRFSAIDSD